MITRLQPRYGAKTRIDVYVDEEYVLTAEKRVVEALGLREGDAWDEEAFWHQAAAPELDAALERCYTYLESAMRSRKQLEDKLKTLGFAPPIRELVLKKLDTLGFADDETFARRYMQRGLADKSVQALRLELRQKGVRQDLIDQIAIQESDESREIDKCAALCRKYLAAPGDRQANRRRAVAACQRRGYPWEQIRAALARVGEETDDFSQP